MSPALDGEPVQLVAISPTVSRGPCSRASSPTVSRDRSGLSNPAPLPSSATRSGGHRSPSVVHEGLARFSLASPVGLRYAVYVSNWAWVLFGGAVTLAAASVVVLWHAFKHLDLKIERLGERLDLKIDKKFDDQRIYFDQKFDQLRDDIAELSRLVAGQGEQIKAQEKQIDRLSGAVFAPPQFGAPGQHQPGAHAPAPAASAEPAAPGEGIASSAGNPEPPPTAAIAPA